MGSEQSSSRREFTYREPAATPRDVEKALEQQRKMYEQKMSQLLQETKRSGTTTTAPPVGPLNSLRASTSNQQQTASTELLERQRTPYNYNQNEIPRSFDSRPLYPNLAQAASSNTGPVYPIGGNATCSNSPQGYNNNMASPNKESPMVFREYYHQDNRDHGAPNAQYMYQKNQQIPQQAQRNSPVQPSAPPSETSSRNSRARSHSRQRGGDNDVNCPTCGKMYGERIYQCNQGHSSCDLCKKRQVLCGQCRQQLTDRRNFDLEKYIMEKKVLCPNSVDGCRLFIKLGDIAIHEKQCPFKALECPSLGSNCSWTGKMTQLPEHFNDMHPLHIQGGVDKEMFLNNVTNSNHIMHYIRIGNFNFLFHIKVSEPDARIYMAVQLIGTKHSAAKWDYEIHIYNKSQPRRKYQYIDKCSAAVEPLQEIVSSTRCAVIPQEYAKTFLCGGSLAYKFFIKRDDLKTNDSATNTTVDARSGPRGPPRRHNFKKFVKKN